MAANDSLEPLDQPDVVHERLCKSRYRGELCSSRRLTRILVRELDALLDTAEKLAGQVAAPVAA